MKKQIIFFSFLLCLIVSFSSCTPEAISSEQDTQYATGGNEIDDPAEPDEED